MTEDSVRRREDHDLLTGSALFTDDLQIEGVLHARFVRSSEPHALITGIDTIGAEAMPGVVAVFTGTDWGDPMMAPPGPMPALTASVAHMSRPVLATERVRFVGEPVAMVVAQSAAMAVDAVEMVEVTTQPLPEAVSVSSALTEETLLFAGSDSNVMLDTSIGHESHLLQGPVRISVSVPSPRVDPVALEPAGVVAIAEPDGVTTVWCGSQTPHMTRAGIAAAIGADVESIRVRVPEVGGAFGQKGGHRVEQVAVVLAAKSLGRPVKWVATRSEMLVSGDHGRGQLHHVTLTASGEGKILTGHIEIVADMGAYPQRGWFIPLTTMQLGPGPYMIPGLSMRARAVVTNTAPIGPYRGAGRPEAALAIERALDELAVATHLDPVEIRRRNFVPTSGMPMSTPTGINHDCGEYETNLDVAIATAAPLVRAARGLETAARRMGVGVSPFVETTSGSAHLGEHARACIDTDKVRVFTGSTATGQGHATVWSQIVSDVLTVDVQDIEILAGDTELLPRSVGSFGSRSAEIGAVAVERVTRTVRDLARQLAASMFEAAVDDIELDGGRFFVRGVPGMDLHIWDVAAEANDRGVSLAASDHYVPDGQSLSSGCYCAVVLVDLETGFVELTDLVAVDDCGRVLNHAIVEGQVHGGAVQGVGQALFEAMRYDESGQPLTTSLHDYAIPTSDSVPFITAVERSTLNPGNSLGVRGVGEAGTIGAPAAVLAAARDALAPLGVGELILPLTPHRVWQAIRDATA